VREASPSCEGRCPRCTVSCQSEPEVYALIRRELLAAVQHGFISGSSSDRSAGRARSRSRRSAWKVASAWHRARRAEGERVALSGGGEDDVGPVVAQLLVGGGDALAMPAVLVVPRLAGG